MGPKYSRYYIYIKPVIQNKIVKTYGSLVFSLITITIFALFAIKPTLSTIVGLEKSINEQEDVLAKLDTKALNLDQGRKNYLAIDSEIRTRLFSLLPDSTDLPKMITSIDLATTSNESSSSGLQFQPIELKANPKNLTKDSTLEKIEFTLNLQGSYNQLTTAFSALTKSDRLIEINSVNFNKQADGPLIMSINANAYFFKH